MDESDLHPHLAPVPDDADERSSIELTLTMAAVRLRARYPDQYLLRDELVKLCELVALLSARISLLEKK